MAKVKLLQILSRISFSMLIGLFLLSMLHQPINKILEAAGLWLFCSALLLEVTYQLLSGRIETVQTRAKLKGFVNLPAGRYQIMNPLTKDDLGDLSNESLDFLRRKILEKGGSDNDFGLTAKCVERIIRKIRPNEELEVFLKKAIKNKKHIRLHWEPLKNEEYP